MKSCLGAYLMRSKSLFSNDLSVGGRVAAIRYVWVLFLVTALSGLPFDVLANEIVATEPVAGCDIVEECRSIIEQHLVEGRLEDAVLVLSDALSGVRTEKHCMGLLLSFYDRLPKQTGRDSLLASRAYQVLGYTYRKFLNDLPASLKYYQLAEDYYAGSYCDSKYWFLRYPVGSLYARLGDYERAYAQYDRILQCLQSTDRDIYRQSLLHKEMANVEIWRGNKTSAFAKLAIAKELAKKIGSTDALLATLFTKVEYRLRHKDGQAALAELKTIKSLLDRDSTSIKASRWSTYYEQKADQLLLGKDTVAAISMLERYVKAERADVKNNSVRSTARARLRLLRLLIHSRQHQEARHTVDIIKQAYVDLNDQARAVDNTWVQLLALEAGLDVNAACKSEDMEALREILLRLETLYRMIDKIQDNAIAIIDKISADQLKKDLDNVYLEALHALYSSRFYSWDAVRGNLAKLKNGAITKSALSRQNQLTDADEIELASIDRALRRLAFATHVDSVTLRVDLLDQQQRILSQYDVNNVLYDGPFLEYFKTQDYIYYLGNSGSEFFFRKNNPGGIINMIASLNSSVGELQDLATNVTLDRLCQMFLPTKIDIVDDLAIVVPPELQTVPFDVLYGYRFGQDSQLNYFLRLGQIAYGQRHKQYRGVLIVQPDYASAGIEVSGLQQLYYTTDEVDTIVALSDAEVLRQASLDDIVMRMDGAKDILHYTGHAVGGLRPQVLLTDRGEVQPAFLEELSQWSSPAELIVLSACESGLGAATQGEIVPSVSSSLLATGVPNVLMSQWAVSDEATSALLSSFYYYLIKEKLQPIVALRKAKQHYRDTEPPDRQHPYYWAGLQIVSQAPYSFSNTASSRAVYYILFLILTLALCVFFFFRSRYSS